MTDTIQMKRYSRRKHSEASHTDSQSAKQGLLFTQRNAAHKAQNRPK